MNARFLQGSILALAALISGLAVWWLRPQPEPPPGDERADYRLELFEMTALRQDGSEGFTVTGPLLERDSEGKTTVISAPQFRVPTETGVGSWNLRAASAWISPDNNEIRLTGAVEVLAPLVEERTPTRFTSERLVLFVDQERATSDAAVTISQGRSILRATGLDLNLQAQRYELLADVEATIHPDPARRGDHGVTANGRAPD